MGCWQAVSRTQNPKDIRLKVESIRNGKQKAILYEMLPSNMNF